MDAARNGTRKSKVKRRAGPSITKLFGVHIYLYMYIGTESQFTIKCFIGSLRVKQLLACAAGADLPVPE